MTTRTDITPWSPRELAAIPKHHRIHISGQVSAGPVHDQHGNLHANPIFQIETLGDDGVWTRNATGYSSTQRAKAALAACPCVRCEIIKMWRAIRRIERLARATRKKAR
jgi:hypothetical protein